MSKYKLVIFDLDGTLADTLPDIQAAYQMVCKEFNLKDPTREDIEAWIGKGQPVAVQRCLTANGITQETHDSYDQFFKDFAQRQMYYYHEIGNTNAKLFDGIKETLEFLQARKISMAICTNKPSSLIPQFLKDFGIAKYFEFYIGQGEVEKDKPSGMTLKYLISKANVTSGQTLMIGDSDNDILAGQDAQVDTIAVTYGYYPEEKLRDLQPTYIVDSAIQITKIVN